MAVAKACCHGSSLSECVWQDICLGEGGTLEAGDSVEIKYTAHVFANHAIGEVRVKLKVFAINSQDCPGIFQGRCIIAANY